MKEIQVLFLKLTLEYTTKPDKILFALIFFLTISS